MARKITIPSTITVGTLAERLDLPVTKLISELMKSGVLATVNERIDFDTASIIVGEMGLDVELEVESDESGPDIPRKKVKSSADGESRPPVVAVMGHVDHGKTTLLDAICGSKTAPGEAGGITQHISAYQVEHNGRKVTFLDTPGHEAFAAIREHGAQLTDVVIIVVAADDGIKPQTLEAIRFARKAGASIIVAINKIDKPGADANRVKQQLSEHDLLVEEWGGEVIAVEVSAKENKNIDKLLDMLLLVADVEDLKADYKQKASGLIIEAHMEQGRGPVAVALVEAGELRKGDILVAGGTFAKVRSLELTNGGKIEKAGPSTPVVVTGFKALPRFGDEFVEAKTEKEARILAQGNLSKQIDGSAVDINSSELLRIISKKNKINELNVIVKADVQGSLKSVVDSLRALSTDDVAVRIVGSGVGSVTEKDVHLASTSNAIIYGFTIDASSTIKQLAARDKVSLRLFSVIYELIDDVKDELQELLPPEIITTEHGRLVVKGIFKTTKTDIICGGEVTKGKLVVPARAKVLRGEEELAEVDVVNLKRGPQDTKEVSQGEMCGVGLKIDSKLYLEEGDRLEFYTQEVVPRKLG